MAEVSPWIRAVHEAAHAVVAVAHGIRVYHATLSPPKTYLRLGESDRLARAKAGLESREVCQQYLDQLLAGLAAETVLTSVDLTEVTTGATTDLIHVKEILGRMPSEEMSNAVTIVKRHRCDIERVAHVLLNVGTIREAEIASIMGLPPLDDEVE